MSVDKSIKLEEFEGSFVVPNSLADDASHLYQLVKLCQTILQTQNVISLKEQVTINY